MVLFKIGEKNQKNPSMQTRDMNDFIRLCHFPPAQLESCS